MVASSCFALLCNFDSRLKVLDLRLWKSERNLDKDLVGVEELSSYCEGGSSICGIDAMLWQEDRDFEIRSELRVLLTLRAPEYCSRSLLLSLITALYRSARIYLWLSC